MHWARESLGVSLADAAKRVDRQPEELIAWENGSAQPTIGPLRELAALYRRPLAAFLLPAVPKDPPPPADFRVTWSHSIAVMPPTLGSSPWRCESTRRSDQASSRRSVWSSPKSDER